MKRQFEKLPMHRALNEPRCVKKHSPLRRLTGAILVLLMLLQGLAPTAFAESPVKLSGSGVIDFSQGGVPAFFLGGTASHLGEFTAHGEVEFVPGEEAGTLVGDGIVVIEAANGDLLVGVVTWTHDDNVAIGHIHFSWRDSVEFSDGTVVSNTGRFVEDRPPGATAVEYGILIAYLAQLIITALKR